MSTENLAQFCGYCGSFFGSEGFRFCPACGKPRQLNLQITTTGSENTEQLDRPDITAMSLGLAVEIQAIQEDGDLPITYDSLGEFGKHALDYSGLTSIWNRPPEDGGEVVSLWVDPTSAQSYLWAANGFLCGDLALIDFWVGLGEGNRSSATLTEALSRSLSLRFELPEHSLFDDTPHNFYIKSIYFGDSRFEPTKEWLQQVIQKLIHQEENLPDIMLFREFYERELTSAL